MLQIQHICKEYRTGKLVQKALDDVSLNLRDNEFVAILGPSGSGKTTLLNIIGGLDRYDSGDLIINGISTKKYKDRDWDSYRNHTIGFVFQSYNLIPHQTVLANVELALTISGIGKAERRKRAVKALKEVGLGEQLHKKPNQMSGGQMQRVAIARALVNDPDILLADEPTGALDSDTSVQVMDLLQEVAKDRLVVMVTHNPELAEEYATRIVNLRDGKIRSDTDPYLPDMEELEKPQHKNMGKSSMSLLTALSLSFNNLRTKKARTLLTSFAGSIGIIGISLILSLSTGVNDYIQDVEEETLSEYPLQIQSTGMDFTSMLSADSVGGQEEEEAGEINVIQMVTDMFSTMDSNDLESLKKYLDSGESGIEEYTNAIEYSYDVVPQIYLKEDEDVRQVNPDSSFEALGIGSSSSSSSMMSSMMSTDVFYEMPEDTDLYMDQYDVKAGRWPESCNECVLVLTSGGSISDFMLYTMGLRDSVELDEMIQQFINEENVEVPEDMGTYTYDDILGITFKLVNSGDYYEYDQQYQVWRDKTDDAEYMKNLVDQGEDIKIVGIVQPSEDANGALLSAGIAYPSSLTEHVVQEAEDSEIVQKQLADHTVNVFTNEAFGEESSQEDFDMNSLVTVDENALQEAFQFDEGAMTEGLSGSVDFSGMEGIDPGTLDLSGMLDLGDITLDLPQMPEMDLGDLMSSLNIQVSSEDMETMISGLLEGYQAYAQGNPQADYSRLGEYFLEYLQTEDAQQRLTQGLSTMIDTGSLREQISQSMEGYMQELMASYSGTLGQALEGQISSAMEQMMNQISSAMETAMTQAIAQIGENLQSAMNIDAEAFSNAFTVNMSGDEMAELFMSMNSTQDATYDSNLRTLGYVDFDVPSGINIYPKDFESKEYVVDILDDYNSRMEAEGKDEQVITYTDVVGSLMSSVTDIIDIISYVLIAFVAISLVVSSIMIGVITYISVLERKKEIGILRAIGASKGNISQVFNAETFIIGFCAGLLGIVITLLLLIPGNALIHHLAGTNNINAALRPGYAFILILLSVVLTLIGGLIPSKKAAKSDPVTALRTE